MDYEELDYKHTLDVEAIAEQHGLEPKDLWEAYCGARAADFYEDLKDIAKDLEDEYDYEYDD